MLQAIIHKRRLQWPLPSPSQQLPTEGRGIACLEALREPQEPNRSSGNRRRAFPDRWDLLDRGGTKFCTGIGDRITTGRDHPVVTSLEYSPGAGGTEIPRVTNPQTTPRSRFHRGTDDDGDRSDAVGDPDENRHWGNRDDGGRCFAHGPAGRCLYRRVDNDRGWRPARRSPEDRTHGGIDDDGELVAAACPTRWPVERNCASRRKR